MDENRKSRNSLSTYMNLYIKKGTSHNNGGRADFSINGIIITG